MTWANPDSDPDAKGDGVKVCRWTQPKENLRLKSSANPYEDDLKGMKHSAKHFRTEKSATRWKKPKVIRSLK